VVTAFRTAIPSAATGVLRRCPANLDIFEREDLLGNAPQENNFRQTLERLYDLPIVGDVRGDGYFYSRVGEGQSHQTNLGCGRS
jgi:adenosylmethionine-8-amino-7-oxononanoate aminotransferase